MIYMIWTRRYTVRLQQYCMLPNPPLTGFKSAPPSAALDVAGFIV
jgi:hypothetical protein